MTNKIDWEKMYRDLESALDEIIQNVVQQDLKEVELTIGKKPPRIYVTYLLPERLLKLRTKSLESETEEEKALLLTQLGEKRSRISEIMKKHNLIPHKFPNPDFKGEDTFTSAYGYEHKQYKI